jgi:putative ABC transport system permease protein
LSRQQYSVLTQEDLLGLIHEVMGILGWLLIGLTAIALFVGGLGVMTVMVMSVSERQREIGIRKATGARSSDVFQQFLVESVIIALAGVLVGLAISTAAGAALRAFTSIKPIVTWQIVALAALVGIGLGSLFGLIPAMRAARQDPVVALRNE